MPRSSRPAASWFLEKPGRRDDGDRAHVHQQFDAGLFEFVEHGLGRRLFIADGEEAFGLACHVGVPVFVCHRLQATSALRRIAITAEVMPEPGSETRCRRVRHVA